jgi:hypothetical protein
MGGNGEGESHERRGKTKAGAAGGHRFFLFPVRSIGRVIELARADGRSLAILPGLSMKGCSNIRWVRSRAGCVQLTDLFSVSGDFLTVEDAGRLLLPEQRVG